MIKYLPSHEYAKIEDNFAYIGISPYAAKQLGNVVYVDMPEVDDEIEKDEEFGAIESVKAASDLFAPLSGTVVEVNEELADNPKLVSDDPLKNWIIKIEISDPGQIGQLLDQEAYDRLCADEQANAH